MSLDPQERYESKHFTGSSHLWAEAHLATLPAESRVLDVGPGNGLMGRFLKERGIEDLYAVEIDPSAREHVRPIYKEVVEKLEEIQQREFTTVLLLDVLEHMTDPLGFLRDLKPYLASDSTLLISLPNVAHWSVRFGLLFGLFEYTERGILDKTHFQFFNRRRVKSLIANAGDYSIKEMSSSIEPVELVLPKFLWNNAAFKAVSGFRQKVAEILPGMMAYQHLAVVGFKKPQSS